MSSSLPEIAPGVVDLGALVRQAGGHRDRYTSGVCSEERIEVFDHDPRDPRAGHASCSPACRPIDVMVTGRTWASLDGREITDPDHIAFLEARRAQQA
jgi:hypothetical protein